VPVALTSQDGPVEHRREVLPAHAAHGDGAELRVLMRQSILLLLFWVAINLQQETQRSFARANFDMLVEAVASWRMLRVTTSMAHSRSCAAFLCPMGGYANIQARGPRGPRQQSQRSQQ
jgi:hypothetical protein